jgi:hypothetical protein
MVSPSPTTVTNKGDSRIMRINNNVPNPHTSDGNSNNHGPTTSAVTTDPQQQNSISVVPQLMDIYTDLAQSSTPQTSTGIPQFPSAAPQLQSGSDGVCYSGNKHRYVDIYSQKNDRGSQRGSHTSPITTTHSSKKAKATEIEECHLSKQGVNRKKGKTSAADQRWLKRFTWPDEVSIRR